MGAVGAAVDRLAHRGPDDSFTAALDRRGGWGMCRLAIRDRSPEGMQPFWFEDSVGVIYNGEIYNTDRVRRLLERRGHVLRTACDTEVVLLAYVAFGTACFGLLDGIFAVAVIDRIHDRLVLARDEFGVKPLAYWAGPGEFAFASELPALRALGVPAEPDDDALALYLRYQYVPEPLTAWRGVAKVPAGTALSIDLTSLEVVAREGFQQPDDEAPRPQAATTPARWVDLTEDAVRRSVESQLVSDRPLGVFLSGGIDSSLVSLFAGEAHPGIRAFGISVPSWERDERRYMEQAARRMRVDLTISQMDQSDFEPLLDRVLALYDEPFGDFSSIPTTSIATTAAQELRVVLTGDGGDELFAGYQRYALAPTAARLRQLPAWTLELAAAVVGRSGRRGEGMLRSIAEERRTGGSGCAGLVTLRTWPEVEALFGDGSPTRASMPGLSGIRLGSAIEQACAMDVMQYLPADILAKVDRATMAVSLEARVPLLSGAVARLCEDMPMSVKRRHGVPKWPLKAVLERRGFGEEFLHRAKTGFSLPIDHWLRTALESRDDLCKLLREPSWPLHDGACGAELDAFLAGATTGHRVWSLLALSSWLQRQ